MIVPLSATYHAPVPIPEIKPPTMMYCDILALFYLDQVKINAYPLVSKLAIAIITRALDWEGQSPDDQRPLDTELVYKRTTEEAHKCKHNVADSVGDVVCLSRSKTTTTQTYQLLIVSSLFEKQRETYRQLHLPWLDHRNFAWKEASSV
jgi:hypothetical protein